MRTLLLITLTLALVACGPDSKHVTLEGKLLNLNQGEFLVYSPDGATPGVDTLTLAGGRFSLTTPCDRPGTLAVIMPGGEEIAVSVEPGHSYSLSGDAQNLARVEVDGGPDNKLLNAFRRDLADSAPSADAAPAPATARKLVSRFVTAHSASPAALYLVGHYFLGPDPDAPAALRLLAILRRAQAGNAAAEAITRRVQELANASPGHSLPAFRATDTDGRTLSASDIRQGRWVVATAASWDYESMAQARRLRTACRDGSWRLLLVALDASRRQWTDAIASGNTADLAAVTRTVCDEQMTEGTLPTALAMRETGLTLLVEHGRVTARGLSGETLYSRLKP